MLHDGLSRSSVPQSRSTSSTQGSPLLQPQTTPSDSNQQTHATVENSQNSCTQFATDIASTSFTHIALPVTPTQNIVLSTALVKIKDRFGNATLARALLDSCSQHCLMSEDFSTRLNFQSSSSYLSIQGIGPSTSTSTKLVSAMVSPRAKRLSNFVRKMQFHVLPRLTVSLPTSSFSPNGWRIPDSSWLADPWFNESSPIDVIIGAEFYMDLLKHERRMATTDGPTLQNTVFGWIVSGRIPSNRFSNTFSNVHVCTTTRTNDQTSDQSIVNSQQQQCVIGGRLRHNAQSKHLGFWHWQHRSNLQHQDAAWEKNLHDRL